MCAIKQRPKRLLLVKFSRGSNYTVLGTIYPGTKHRFPPVLNPHIGIAALKKTCVSLKR